MKSADCTETITAMTKMVTACVTAVPVCLIHMREVKTMTDDLVNKSGGLVNDLANDRISRQAAIDAIDGMPTVIDADGVQFIEKQCTRLRIAVLPSAQPESCEYYALCRHGRDENKLRARLGFCEYCNEDADGYVKPIEKNCHAFIRFGMNGWELSLKANGWHGSAKIRYCPMCGRDLLVK